MVKIKNLFNEKKSFSTIISILVGLFASIIVLFIIGTNPFFLLRQMFLKSFSNLRNIFLFLQQLALFMLLGLSAFFSFKVGFFNIGAPGQMIFAGMCASLFALHTSFPKVIHVLLTTLVAIGAAVFLTLLTVCLKIYFNFNDVVATILFNWIALKILQLLAFNTEVFKIKLTRTSGATPSVPESSNWIINNVFENVTFTITIFVAFLVLITSIILMKSTKLGFKINIVGKSDRVAYINGYPNNKLVLISVLFSGVIIGLFTMGYYFGKNTQISEISSAFPPSMGFNGLIIFTIANKSVLGIFFASLLMNFLNGSSSENLIGIPTSTTELFAAIIFYCVSITKIFENTKYLKIKFWNLKNKMKIRRTKNEFN